MSVKNSIIILLLIIFAVGVWFLSPGTKVNHDDTNMDNIDNVDIGTKTSDATDVNTNETSGNPIVVFKTNKGDIKLELFEDKMPITTGNFLKLAKEGYYDGTKFHRVINGFMIQGGDSNSKGDDTMSYGTGGPGYTIKDEFVKGLSNVRGTIAMANTGQPNSGGSQFFINLVDNTGLDFDKEPLSSKHPVFGKVVEGMDVVDAIAVVETGARNIPVESVVIENIEVGE